MKEEEIVKLENELEMEKKEFERIERIENVSELLPPPKGIFRKRCPICNTKIKSGRLSKPTYILQIFWCACGYEYVRRIYLAL